jgi:hypothetical protein
VIDTWDKAANKIVARSRSSRATWHHVMVTFDGTISGHQASAIYVDGKRVKPATDPNTVGGNIETAVPLRLGARQGDDSKLNGKVACRISVSTAACSHERKSPARATACSSTSPRCPPDQRTKEQVDQLYQYFISNIDVPSRELRTRLDKLKSEQAGMRAARVRLAGDGGEKEEPFAHVLPRRLFRPRREGRARHSRRAAADAGGRSEEPPRPRPLAERSRQPAARPRDDEPRMVLLLRCRHRRNQ